MKKRNRWAFLVLPLVLTSLQGHGLRYKSAVQQQAEELIAQTRPGYYQKRFTPTYTSSVDQTATTLRSQAACGNTYLCSAAALPVP